MLYIDNVVKTPKDVCFIIPKNLFIKFYHLIYLQITSINIFLTHAFKACLSVNSCVLLYKR